MENNTISVEVLKIKIVANSSRPSLVANARIRLTIFGISQEIGGFSIWESGNDIGITPLKIGMERMYQVGEKAIWAKITNEIKLNYLKIKKNELSNSFSIKK